MTVLAFSNWPNSSTSKLFTHRRDLKIKIYHERREPGRKPVCPICGKEITIEGGADMHEVFITRGDAMGINNEDDHLKIYDACNCVLVHHGDCHRIAATDAGKQRCALHIIRYEGLEKIGDFFEKMTEIFTSGLPTVEWLYCSTLPLIKPQSQPPPRWEF